MPDRAMDEFDPQRPAVPVLLGRPVQWTLGFLSGLVKSVLMKPEERRQRALDRWTDQWFRQVRTQIRGGLPLRDDPDDPMSLATLNRMLAGRSRGYVVAKLGSPPAASAPPEAQSNEPAGKWTAEVWYYPTNRRKREGIAITFANDVVTNVDRLSGPK